MNTTADQQNKAVRLSLVDILGHTAIALIAVSLLAQCLRYGITLSGSGQAINPGLLLVVEYSGIVIAPGMFLAFVKFLLNAIRSFKDEKARIQVVVYFLILLFPLIMPVLMATSAARAAVESEPISFRDEPESEQFMIGHDWAKANGPIKDSECLGSNDFNRGCRKAISERRNEQFEAGRKWAKANLPSKASECHGAPYFIKGCRNFFLEHLARPKPVGQGQFEGMTTAECKAEVNANYEVSAQLDIENGNPHAVESTSRRHWLPELQNCENYDKLRENTFMPEAYSRLQYLLGKIKAGEVVTEDEKAGMLKDFGEMSKIRDQPYRTAYLNMADEYFERQGGQYKEPATVYARISCAEYQTKIDELQKFDKQHVADMRALTRADGVVMNNIKHNELNRQRIDMLWDWKYYNDGAKAAGCQIEINGEAMLK